MSLILASQSARQFKLWPWDCLGGLEEQLLFENNSCNSEQGVPGKAGLLVGSIVGSLQFSKLLTMAFRSLTAKTSAAFDFPAVLQLLPNCGGSFCPSYQFILVRGDAKSPWVNRIKLARGKGFF